MRILAVFTRAMLLGSTVFAITYVCGWLNYRELYVHTQEYLETRKTIATLNAAIIEHRKAHGSLPFPLEDLQIVKDKQVPLREGGTVADGWGYRMQYNAEKDGEFILYSDGKDWRPYGVGINAKITADSELLIEHPTVWQFARLPESEYVLGAALIAGLFALVIVMLDGARPEKYPSFWSTAAKYLVTALVACYFAITLATAHMVGNGH